MAFQDKLITTVEFLVERAQLNSALRDVKELLQPKKVQFDLVVANRQEVRALQQDIERLSNSNVQFHVDTREIAQAARQIDLFSAKIQDLAGNFVGLQKIAGSVGLAAGFTAARAELTSLIGEMNVLQDRLSAAKSANSPKNVLSSIQSDIRRKTREVEKATTEVESSAGQFTTEFTASGSGNQGFSNRALAERVQRAERLAEQRYGGPATRDEIRPIFQNLAVEELKPERDRQQRAKRLKDFTDFSQDKEIDQVESRVSNIRQEIRSTIQGIREARRNLETDVEKQLIEDLRKFRSVLENEAVDARQGAETRQARLGTQEQRRRNVERDTLKLSSEELKHFDEHLPRIALERGLSPEDAAKSIKKPGFLDFRRLQDNEALVQLGFAAAFGGVPSVVGGAIGGATPLGPSGALLGSTLLVAFSETIGKATEALKELAGQSKEAGIALERSILGIASIRQESTDVTDRFGREVNTGDALKFQQGEARKIQLAARQSLSEFGIGGATEATFVQGIVSALSQRGITANASEVSQIARLLGGTIQSQRPGLLDNTQQLLKDLQDVLGGGANASRTVLSQIIRPALPGILNARNAQGLIAGLQVLAPVAEAASQSENPVVSQQKLEGQQEILKANVGDALLQTTVPAIEELTKVLKDPELQKSLVVLAQGLGELESASIKFSASLLSLAGPAIAGLGNVLQDVGIAFSNIGTSVSFVLTPLKGLFDILGQADLSHYLGLVADFALGFKVARDQKKSEDLEQEQFESNLQREKQVAARVTPAARARTALKEFGLEDAFTKFQKEGEVSSEIQIPRLKELIAEEQKKPELGLGLQASFFLQQITDLKQKDLTDEDKKFDSSVFGNLEKARNRSGNLPEIIKSQEATTAQQEAELKKRLSKEGQENDLKLLNDQKSKREASLNILKQGGASHNLITTAQANLDDAIKAIEDFGKKGPDILASQERIKKSKEKEVEYAQQALDAARTETDLIKARGELIASSISTNSATGLAAAAQSQVATGQEAAGNFAKELAAARAQESKSGKPGAVLSVFARQAQNDKFLLNAEEQASFGPANTRAEAKLNTAPDLLVGADQRLQIDREVNALEQDALSQRIQANEATKAGLQKQLEGAKGDTARGLQFEITAFETFIAGEKKKQLGLSQQQTEFTQQALDLSRKRTDLEKAAIDQNGFAGGTLALSVEKTGLRRDEKILVQRRNEARTPQEREDVDLLIGANQVRQKGVEKQRIDSVGQDILQAFDANNGAHKLERSALDLAARFHDLSSAVTDTSNALKDFDHEERLRSLGREGQKIAAGEKLLKAGGSESELDADTLSLIKNPDLLARFELDTAREENKSVLNRTKGSRAREEEENQRNRLGDNSKRADLDLANFPEEARAAGVLSNIQQLQTYAKFKNTKLEPALLPASQTAGQALREANDQAFTYTGVDALSLAYEQTKKDIETAAFGPNASDAAKTAAPSKLGDTRKIPGAPAAGNGTATPGATPTATSPAGSSTATAASGDDQQALLNKILGQLTTIASNTSSTLEISNFTTALERAF